MTAKKKDKRGGARPGSGRKAEVTGEPRTVTMKVSEREKAEILANRNNNKPLTNKFGKVTKSIVSLCNKTIKTMKIKNKNTGIELFASVVYRGGDKCVKFLGTTMKVDSNSFKKNWEILN